MVVDGVCVEERRLLDPLEWREEDVVEAGANTPLPLWRRLLEEAVLRDVVDPDERRPELLECVYTGLPVTLVAVYPAAVPVAPERELWLLECV